VVLPVRLTNRSVDDRLHTLVEGIEDELRRRPPPPHVVGISGAVAVGKSTVAGQLGEAFTGRGRRVDVVATDAFLHPNVILDERGLTLRKGFPETFDLDALVEFVARVHEGRKGIRIPVYSHAVYDILPGEHLELEEPDLVVLEGVIALQPPVVDHLDVAVYVDADEDDVRRWFVARFLELTEASGSDAASFYRIFSDMSADEVRRIAEATWDGINGVNLREHIAPSREKATFVVSKAADHTIRDVRRLQTG
jgi:type I pantothenate kinase